MVVILTQEQQKVYTWAQTGKMQELASFLKSHPYFNLNFKGNSHLERTALHEAVESGHVRLTELLLNNGARMTATDIFGATPLHTASEYGHFDIVKMLIKNDANVLQSDKHGNIPLHWASATGHAKIADLLIKYGGKNSVFEKNHWGKTPLHNAKNRDVADVLIKNGANVMSRDIYGNTPLHDAIESGRFDVAGLLIKNHTDVNALNNKGQTPQDILSQYQQNHLDEDVSQLQKLLIESNNAQTQTLSLNQRLASNSTKTPDMDNRSVDDYYVTQKVKD